MPLSRGGVWSSPYCVVRCTSLLALVCGQSRSERPYLTAQTLSHPSWVYLLGRCSVERQPMGLLGSETGHLWWRKLRRQWAVSLRHHSGAQLRVRALVVQTR